MVILERGRVIAAGSVQELVGRTEGAVIDLTFDGAPPASLDGYPTTVEGSVMRVETNDPGRSTAHILGLLGSDSSRVHGIEIIRPSLETVFLTLTGRRYEEGEEIDVAAS